MSDEEPCPCCGAFALFWDFPVVPEYLSDEAAEEFISDSLPELSCRACGECVGQMTRIDYEAD